MAPTRRAGAGAALCSYLQQWMSVALVAATALLSFSSQEIVHAAAVFEAAFDSTLFRSLLTGPAASAQAYLATMKTWHAAAAPAAAVKGFFHHDLLAEPAAASECEVVDLIQPAAADSGEFNCFEDGADSEGECVLFKGKDGHDTDGSLSLGKEKASGRVDVPVGVNAFLSAETFCRSGPSVASLPVALAS